MEKFCRKCQTTKPFSDFGKDKLRKYGLTTACKKCRNPQSKSWRDKNPERVKFLNEKNREVRKEYYANPERKRKNRSAFLLKKFGITADQYDELLKKQGGVCKICERYKPMSNKPHMHVDHCHTTGKVRGILCGFCNVGLGSFEDKIERFENAIKYLKENKNE